MNNLVEIQELPTELFDQFWFYYPRKDNKKKARMAFKKLNPNQELVNLMINNIQQRLESNSWRLTEKHYIPIPTTYLNGERWEDEIIAIPKKKGLRTITQDDMYNVNW